MSGYLHVSEASAQQASDGAAAQVSGAIVETSVRAAVGDVATVTLGENSMTLVSSDRVDTTCDAQQAAGDQTVVRVRLRDEDIAAALDLGLVHDTRLVNTDKRSETYGVAYDNKRNLCTEIYESRDALQRRCREFASQQGFSLRVHDTRYTKATQEGNAKYVCKHLKGQQQFESSSTPACPFSINVYGKGDQWKVTKIQFLHDHYMHAGFQTASFVESTLHSNEVAMRQRDSSFARLLSLVKERMVPAYTDNWQSVSGTAITQWLLTEGHEISRQTASKIKIAVADRIRGDIVESYQKLEDYLAQVARSNDGSHCGFDKDGNTFRRACFFPGACLKARKHCKNIIGLDGAHLKAEMNKRGVFLVAATKDFNNHILIFGLALVLVENYDNWHWFLSQMQTAVGNDDEFTPVFVSDRQKGLLRLVTDVFPTNGHRYCVRHIIGNIAKIGPGLSQAEQELVFLMARAESENDFELEAKKLEESRPAAVEYLRKIEKKHWVTHAISEETGFATYDEVTSNISESANNWIGNDCRSTQPLHAFEGYMMKVVKLFSETTQRSCAGAVGSSTQSLRHECV